MTAIARSACMHGDFNTGILRPTGWRAGAAADQPTNQLFEAGDPPASRVPYTLGPVLRTLHIKNLGRDLAPQRLRTCPCGQPMGPAGQKNFEFSGA